MKRIRKRPQDRAADILASARKLFFARGYETTSVNDVIADAGISKGAFYHYFDSKEALLAALTEQLARENMEALEPLLVDPRLDAVGRINALFAGVRQLKVETAAEMRRTFEIVFKPDNIALFHRLDAAISALVVPVLAAIIAQGVRERSMDAGDPEATAEMILHFRLSLAKVMHRALVAREEGDLDRAAAMLDERLRLYGVAIDRLLRLPDGTIVIGEPGFSRAFLQAGP